MANYDVDIKIALKGSQKLKQLTDQLKATNKEVGKLNAATIKAAKSQDKSFSIKKIQNINNYSKAVAKAERTLRRAAAGTEQEQLAVKALVAARKQHNQQLERQNKLLKEEELLQGVGRRPKVKGSNRISASSGLSSPLMGAQDIKGSPMERAFGYKPGAGGKGRGGGFGGLQSAALGVGFPLLFGGGAGSIAGGLLGSAGGFGGQIFGSAIGQQIDQFAQKAGDLSKALDGLGGSTQALEALIGTLNTATAKRIQNLEQSGQAAKAANESFKILSDTIGRENALALNRFGDATNQLGKDFTRLTTIFGAVSIRIGELIRDLVILRDIPGFILKGFKPPSDPASGAPEETPELAFRREQARRGLQVSQLQTAALRAQGTGSLEEAAEAEKKIVNQQKINDLKEFDKKVTDGLKDATKDIAEKEKIIEDAKRAILQIDQQLIEAVKRRKKETERLAEQEKRRQKAAREKFEREEKQRRSQYDAAVVSEAGQFTALLEIKQQLTALQEGESAALQQRSNDLGNILNNEKTILDIQYQAADANAKSLEEQQSLRNAYLDQVEALNVRAKLEAEAIAQAQSRIQLEKTLLSLQQQQALRGIQTGIGRRIEDANFRPTGNQAQDEQLQLRIDQIRRQKDAELELNDAIKAQKALRDSNVSDETIEAANKEIKRLEERLALTKELLPQLDAAEQAQLKFNQAFEAAKPIADAVTTGLFGAVSAIVDGTKSAEEAFADFLKNIGEMLIQAAAQQIATYIAIGIARAFAMGGSNAASAPPAPNGTQVYGGQVINTGMMTAAEGAFVTGPTPALVGEGGEPEYIIPQSKMRESMDRYSRGARGSAVIPAAGDSGASGAGGGVAVAAPIDVRFKVERINNVDYVTAAEFQEGMQQAAKQGAQRGEQQAIKRLQMSSSTRRRVGL